MFLRNENVWKHFCRVHLVIYLCVCLCSLQVSWVRRKGDELNLITFGRTTYSSDSRYSLEYQEPNDWQLLIQYANERDEGHYECQVSAHPPMVLLVYLTVVGKWTNPVWRWFQGQFPQRWRARTNQILSGFIKILISVSCPFYPPTLSTAQPMILRPTSFVSSAIFLILDPIFIFIMNSIQDVFTPFHSSSSLSRQNRKLKQSSPANKPEPSNIK